jgi:hypothetical protein
MDFEARASNAMNTYAATPQDSLANRFFFGILLAPLQPCTAELYLGYGETASLFIHREVTNV